MEFVVYKEAKLSYQKIGKGENVFVLFHGYGQDSSVFSSWVENLDQNLHTFYLIDIFFHGQSEWDDNYKLDDDFWLKIFLRFVEQNNLKNFTLFGYSLGAKFALATYEVMPTRIKYIYLVAPDGFNSSFWYTLLTANVFTLKIFKLCLNNWSFFKKLISYFARLGFVSKSLRIFVESNLDTAEKRVRIFKTWSVFRFLTFNVKELSQQIRKHYTSMEIYLGTKDEIIKKKNLNDFLAKSKRYELIEIDANHQTILKMAINEIVKRGLVKETFK